MLQFSNQRDSLRKVFSSRRPGNPAVEDRLLVAGEHLHAEGLTAGVAFGEGLQELHLQAVRCGVVMGFAEIDDARIAGNGKHLRLADEGAGRQMHDIADFGRSPEAGRGSGDHPSVVSRRGCRRSG